MARVLNTKRAMFALGFFGICGSSSAEPLPMPAIPIAVSAPRPVPDVVPAGVMTPVILPGTVPAPALVVPSIAPPSELPAPALPALTLPPSVAPELPRFEAPKLPAVELPKAVTLPIEELPKPAIVEPTPITPPAKPFILPEPSLPVKSELKLLGDNSGYNPIKVVPLTAPTLPTMIEVAPLPSPASTLPAPREDTMKLNPVNTIKSAVIGTILATAPAAAEEPKTVPTPTADVKALETDLKAQIKLLDDQIKALKDKNTDYNDILAGRANSTDGGLLKRVANLEASLKRIEESLKALNEKMNSSTSAASPLAGIGNAVIAAGKSKVRLVNEYPVRISIVVNGVSYPLEAKQSRDLEVPAGAFNYQLIADGIEKVSSNIKEGETVTLRIR